MRLLLLTLVLLCSVQIVAAQMAPDLSRSGIETVYLAKDDGRGQAGEPVFEFKVTDIPIYCVVQLERKGRSVVKMVFVAMNVAGVKPDTRVVTSVYTTTEGQDRVNFTGRPEGVWIPGKYRVDIFVNDKLATDVEFVIRGNTRSVIPKTVKSSVSKRPKPPGGPSEP